MNGHRLIFSTGGLSLAMSTRTFLVNTGVFGSVFNVVLLVNGNSE